MGRFYNSESSESTKKDTLTRLERIIQSLDLPPSAQQRLQVLSDKLDLRGYTGIPEADIREDVGEDAACFGSAHEAIGAKKKIHVSKAEVTAHVSLFKELTGGFQLAAELDVKIPGLDSDTVQRLVEKAHHVCPYFKATRGNIDVQVRAEAA